MNKPITHDSVQKECEGILDLLKNRRVDTINWHVDLSARLSGFYALIAPLYQQASEVVAKVASNIFRINRTTPFDPVPLLDTGASFWRGPKDGKGLKGEIEQDARSLALTKIDLESIRFKAYLPEGKSVINGEDRTDAIKAALDTALDPQIGQSLYEEEGQKSLRFLHDTTGVTWMEFLGGTLRSAGGCRYSLVLCRYDGGSWRRSYVYLDSGRFVSNPAAVVS